MSTIQYAEKLKEYTTAVNQRKFAPYKHALQELNETISYIHTFFSEEDALPHIKYALITKPS